jgi:RHS repeat-associated protein
MTRQRGAHVYRCNERIAHANEQLLAARRLFCVLVLALLALVTGSPAFAQVNVAARANGGTATASSAISAMMSGSITYTFPPSGAIDGDRKGLNWGFGGGWNDETAATYPDWLQVDFSRMQTISEIDVFTIQDNYTRPLPPTPLMTFSRYGITAFQVQYWTGSAWQDIPGGKVSGNKLVWRRFMFAPITTDRIRVVVNAALDNYSRIVEVEAWAIAAMPSNIAPKINLTAPGLDAAFAAPATVQLSAEASDADGSVSKVEFYRDDTLVATVTKPVDGTYSYSDANLPAGTYSYVAKAYDNAAPPAVEKSATRVVTVSPNAAPPTTAQTYYIHTDHLNTPRVISNAGQQVVWRWDNLDPFGANVPDENPSGAGSFTCNLRFPGQYFDRETSLHYNYFRDYDPWVGRYVESDPIGLRGGLNTYAYAFDPLTQSDPQGLMGRGSSPSYNGPLVLKQKSPCGFGVLSFPEFTFRTACDSHDGCFTTCGANKSQCDDDFCRRARGSCPPGDYGCVAMAALYCEVVRSVPASLRFDPSQKAACASNSCSPPK